MFIKHIRSLLATISTTVLAATTPPPGAVVAAPGANLQALVDANAGKTIFLQPGMYQGQLTIKHKITMIGYSESPESYKGNKATITIRRAQEEGYNNDQTAAVQVHTDGAKFYNVNFENTWEIQTKPDPKDPKNPNKRIDLKNQALAVSTMGDEIAFYGCNFDGWQDTIETEGKDGRSNGKQFFGKCLFQGCTDFIFGKSAIAWFEDCDIRVKKREYGYITAQGRDNENDKAQYVFNECNIGGNALNGAYTLGRPWRAYAQVTFQYCKQSAVINATGWSRWGLENRDATVKYFEYKNTGPGANRGDSKTKHYGGQQATGPRLIENVLGDTSWIDPKYLK